MSVRDADAVARPPTNASRSASSAAAEPPCGPPLRSRPASNRGGVPPADAAAVARRLLATPGVDLAGIWTHLCCPDDAEAVASAQVARFEAAVAALARARASRGPTRHLAASGGLFAGTAPTCDLVRPGLAVVRRPRRRPAASPDARIAPPRRPAARHARSRPGRSPSATSRRARASATAAAGAPSAPVTDRDPARRATATATCAARSRAPRRWCADAACPLVGHHLHGRAGGRRHRRAGRATRRRVRPPRPAGRRGASRPAIWRARATRSPGRCSPAWLRAWTGCTIADRSPGAAPAPCQSRADSRRDRGEGREGPVRRRSRRSTRAMRRDGFAPTAPRTACIEPFDAGPSRTMPSRSWPRASSCVAPPSPPSSSWRPTAAGPPRRPGDALLRPGHPRRLRRRRSPRLAASSPMTTASSGSSTGSRSSRRRSASTPEPGSAGCRYHPR